MSTDPPPRLTAREREEAGRRLAALESALKDPRVIAMTLYSGDVVISMPGECAAAIREALEAGDVT